jgi:lipopolysaccharide export system protein LptC
MTFCGRVLSDMALARKDNFHSRLVLWLKITLPLVALGLLATLFLLGRTVRPEDAIPYASVDVEDRLRTPRLTQPEYAGMTEDGAALTIKAAEARPGVAGSDDAGEATAISGLIEMPLGGTATMMAGAGRLDSAAARVILTEGVSLTSSTGYRLTMPGAAVALNQTDVTSQGAVLASGPLGRIEAGGMHLGQDAAGAYILDFTLGVRLIYLPPKGN